MKVVQMLPALDSGGVERGTLELAKHLVGLGHSSVVISERGRMTPQLLAEGSEHLDWPVGAKRWSTWRWIKRVRDYLREAEPDILHLRSRLPAWVGYLAWKKLSPSRRPALVTTVHGPYSVSRYSAVMTKGQRVIVISRMIHDYVLANYPHVEPSRIRLIYRGVDTQDYSLNYRPDANWRARFDQEFPQLRERFVVTLPARITRWKGQEAFLEIIHALSQRGDIPVHGLMVGEPHARKLPFYHALQARIDQLGLGKQVSFAGHRSDLRNILAISNVVLSLASSPEAFGRTTVEALSLGIPTAGFDHGGVAEQLQELLPEGRVPVGDLGVMAELIYTWYKHPPLIKENRVFTLENMLRKTVQVYQELLTERAHTLP